MRRVAITGVGIVSCLGNTREAVLGALQEGRSGIELIPERKTLGFRSSLGGRIKELGAPDIPKRNLRQMGLGAQYGTHAARQAIEDAGWGPEEVQSDQTALIIGCTGNYRDVYQLCHSFHEEKLKLGGTALVRVT